MRVTCGVQLKDKKRSIDLVFISDLSEIIYQLAMASSFCW